MTLRSTRWIFTLLVLFLQACPGPGPDDGGGGGCCIGGDLTQQEDAAVVLTKRSVELQGGPGSMQTTDSTVLADGTTLYLAEGLLAIDTIAYTTAPDCSQPATFRERYQYGPFMLSITDGTVGPDLPRLQLDENEGFCDVTLLLRSDTAYNTPAVQLLLQDSHKDYALALDEDYALPLAIEQTIDEQAGLHFQMVLLWQDWLYGDASPELAASQLNGTFSVVP